MRLQDQIVKITQHALDDLCRAALALPEDKRDWNPGGASRSALSQMREIAGTPAIMLPIILGTPSKRYEHGRTPGVPTTIEECVEKARAEFGQLCQTIGGFPDMRLDEEIQTPFGDESVMTMADALMLPYWNLVYHLGQISQLQLILGDTEMH